MCVTLDTLELTRDELEWAKDRVRQLAYLKWESAGRPYNGSTKFWLEAERQWIEHEYTPHRDDTVARRQLPRAFFAPGSLFGLDEQRANWYTISN